MIEIIAVTDYLARSICSTGMAGYAVFFKQWRSMDEAIGSGYCAGGDGVRLNTSALGRCAADEATDRSMR
ncbi:hypothetical protein BN874_1370024 [Candidatus Contendobacter odensis Run_B_J11]|uniref:Uncharacterized protein n=1 Tax=Candidatus Contendobacter odensis Run_B_J11 TaxID=1400861 RepID=A0A7U7G995_9GAMM|nr:hypothetical protein BN874_1370024 [Candidatus Contendobacter odensis Run_B_J11]